MGMTLMTFAHSIQAATLAFSTIMVRDEQCSREVNHYIALSLLRSLALRKACMHISNGQQQCSMVGIHRDPKPN